MIKFILGAALMSAPTAVNAQDVSLCPKIGELAGSVMSVRQHGIPKSAVINAIKPNGAYKLALAMVDLAYTVPVYFAKDAQDQAIIDFKNQTELLCYKSAIK